MSINRREFLKGTAWMGGAALAAGCHLNRLGFGEGGIMQNYAYRKLMPAFFGAGTEERFLHLRGADRARPLERQPDRESRRADRRGRSQRRGQNHARQTAAAALRPERGRDPPERGEY